MVGERLPNGFLVTRRIASGAVAEIFEATDGARRLAVKVFPERHRLRAERELRCGTGLDHPNLNPVLGLVETAGGPAVLLPFLPGVRLDRAYERLDRRAFLAAVGGVLAGLGHLHERGTVHRDVKPENIVLSGRGRAVLFDFDLALPVGERGERAAGTLAYLSPEQAAGRPAEAASDLYGVGVILYRGLTGQVPFTGTVQEVLRAHQHDAPSPPSSFAADLAPFDRTVLGLLAKDPEERPRSASAAWAALEPLLG